MSDIYEVLALRYASNEGRLRHENFLNDPHVNGPMPMSFFIWVIRNEHRTIVVDTGFDYVEGERRKRRITRLPRECLAMVGIDAAQVKDVIITHLHFDHAGTTDDFPSATFHLQDAEMSYATGRYMCHPELTHPFTADCVCDMVRAVFRGRVGFHEGDAEIAPNVTVHKVGGHSAGLQVVRVLTRRGWIVLASDAAHYYENFEARKAFPLIYHLGDVHEAFRRVEALSPKASGIIPGHDPLVLTRYPAYSRELEGIVTRLDVEPSDP